jgi:hypothetical protein
MGRAGLLLLSGVAVLGYLGIGHLRDPGVISAAEFEREKAKDSALTQFHPGRGRPTGKPRLVTRPFLDQIILRIARAWASP